MILVFCHDFTRLWAWSVCRPMPVIFRSMREANSCRPRLSMVLLSAQKNPWWRLLHIVSDDVHGQSDVLGQILGVRKHHVKHFWCVDGDSDWASWLFNEKLHPSNKLLDDPMSSQCLPDHLFKKLVKCSPQQNSVEHAVYNFWFFLWFLHGWRRSHHSSLRNQLSLRWAERRHECDDQEHSPWSSQWGKAVEWD